MRAMVLRQTRHPLVEEEVPDPEPGPKQVRVKVMACGVCRTDLHVVDGDLPPGKMPIIPGHEIVGRIDKLGPEVEHLSIGQRVGVPWLGHTCGHCPYCAAGQENLCDAPLFTGYTRDGGFAELAVVDADFAIPLPEGSDDVALAPLLCAGLIGWRSLRRAGEGRRVGLFGFGAAAHILAQILKFQGREVYAFTRPGDHMAQAFARQLGAIWAGGADERPEVELDTAIIFAPVGSLVVTALKLVRKGGRVVCGGIHMSDIPSFPYELLWGEREIVSVANLTRDDARSFFEVAAQAVVTTETFVYGLTEANRALEDLRKGAFQGAAVLVP